MCHLDLHSLIQIHVLSYLAGGKISSLDRIEFPANIKSVSVLQTSVSTLDDAEFPVNVTALYVLFIKATLIYTHTRVP